MKAQTSEGKSIIRDVKKRKQMIKRIKERRENLYGSQMRRGNKILDESTIKIMYGKRMLSYLPCISDFFWWLSNARRSTKVGGLLFHLYSRLLRP